MEKLLTMAAVGKMLGVSFRTLKQWQKLGSFPKGIPTPSGRVRFRESDIVKWMEGQVA